MARRCERIEVKTTSSGIVVTLLDNTVIKRYSRISIVFMTFNSHKEALKEYRKHKQGYKRL